MLLARRNQVERSIVLALAYLTLLAMGLLKVVSVVAFIADDLFRWFVSSRYGWIITFVLLSYLEIYLYVVQRTCP